MCPPIRSILGAKKEFQSFLARVLPSKRAATKCPTSTHYYKYSARTLRSVAKILHIKWRTFDPRYNINKFPANFDYLLNATFTICLFIYPDRRFCVVGTWAKYIIIYLPFFHSSAQSSTLGLTAPVLQNRKKAIFQLIIPLNSHRQSLYYELSKSTAYTSNLLIIQIAVSCCNMQENLSRLIFFCLAWTRHGMLLQSTRQHIQ